MNRLACIVALVFFANTLLVSAWAVPCVHTTESETAMPLHSEAPCHHHAQEESKESTHHCDGKCFCIHASASQIPLLEVNSILLRALLVDDRIAYVNQQMVNFGAAPPSPPPKPIS